jgi:hypothetical protein
MWNDKKSAKKTQNNNALFTVTTIGIMFATASWLGLVSCLLDVGCAALI